MRHVFALLAAVTSLLLAVPAAAPARPPAPAAPYIAKPGVKEQFKGPIATFTATIWCGSWQAIVQFTAGTRGAQVYRKTVYVCESSSKADVRFTLASRQLAEDGLYQYRLKVGRHDESGRVTKWTDSVVGDFTVG